MRGVAAQISLFSVSLLLGMLLVVQLLSHGRSEEITRLPPQELSELIATLSAGNRQLRTAVADLSNQVREYQEAEREGKSVFEVTSADLERVRAFAGLAAVSGPGVEVAVDGTLDAIAVNDLLHELRNAGAEAIAVQEVRITARSVAVQDGGGVQIDGVAITTPFAIRAIGPPEGLLLTLQRPGGIISLLQQYVQATIELRQVPRLELPATQLDLRPVIAEPVD